MDRSPSKFEQLDIWEIFDCSRVIGAGGVTQVVEQAGIPEFNTQTTKVQEVTDFFFFFF
jgi:hypothetical protein